MLRLVVLFGLLLFTFGAPAPIASPIDYAMPPVEAAVTEHECLLKGHLAVRLLSAVKRSFYQSAALTLIQKPSFVTKPPAPEKEVIISIDNQEMYWFENGRIIRVCLVSTGIAGHRTPTGDYEIRNKIPNAWSSKYECSMLHWMAITKNAYYGIHGLTGSSYLKKLGRPASHGCIRLSRVDAEDIYHWAEIGMPVKIVNEFDPIPLLRPPPGTSGPPEKLEPGIF